MGKLFQKTESPSQQNVPSFSFFNRKKVILLLGVLLILSTLSVGYVLGKEKEITLVIDGQTKTIETSHKDLQTLLLEQKIIVTANDKISVPLDSKLKDGQVIDITHAVPITLKVGEEKKEVFTTLKTVDELLKQEKTILGELDKIEPAISTLITPKMEIVITRVTKEIIKKEEVISFGIVRKADAKLPKGKEEVITKGKQGKVVKSVEITYENGKEVGQKLVKQDVIEPKVDQIVSYGTRVENPIVSRGGLSFRPRKTLTNVEISQYTGGTHTYLGTTPTAGRTISVDPSAIPLGWWVYIEGLGYRRAEDIGSAVKGNEIDVYAKDRSSALAFGRRYGYKVHIIGPNKPN